jgi:putative phosphoribosyl transferase
MNSKPEFAEHFANREEAARLLAKKLANCDIHEPVVLAIPRGAVGMAKIIAAALGGVADIVLVKKIGHPQNPEFAVASVTEEGQILIGQGARESGLKLEDLRPLALTAIQEIERQRRLFTPDREAKQVNGREVVIVDDGIATGATMKAAIQSVRSAGAERIVVASPVASRQAIENLIEEGVEIVILALPQVFITVSHFYDDFSQIEDQEVISTLRGADVSVSLQ